MAVISYAGDLIGRPTPTIDSVLFHNETSLTFHYPDPDADFYENDERMLVLLQANTIHETEVTHMMLEPFD